MKSVMKIIVLLLIIVVYSCSRPGLGGKVTIVAFLQHHGYMVKSYLGNIDTVYVKYNAKEFPGTDPIAYDVFFVGDIGREYINCNKLKWGNYYLYAVAIDSVTSHRVSGGVPIQIKYSEQKKSINIIIPLSE